MNNVHEAEFYSVKNHAPVVEASNTKFMQDAADMILIDLKQAAAKCHITRKTLTNWEEEKRLPIKKASTDKSPHQLRVIDLVWLEHELEQRGKSIQWIVNKDYELVKPRKDKIEITPRNNDAKNSSQDIEPSENLPALSNIHHETILINMCKQNKKLNLLVFIVALFFMAVGGAGYIAHKEQKNYINKIDKLNLQLEEMQTQLSDNKKEDQKYLASLIGEYKNMIEEEKQNRVPYFYFWKH